MSSSADRQRPAGLKEHNAKAGEGGFAATAAIIKQECQQQAFTDITSAICSIPGARAAAATIPSSADAAAAAEAPCYAVAVSLPATVHVMLASANGLAASLQHALLRPLLSCYVAQQQASYFKAIGLPGICPFWGGEWLAAALH